MARRIEWRRAPGLLVLAALVAAPACSRRTCKEAGCFGWTKITYPEAVTGAYDLEVSTPGLTVSGRCPQPLQQAVPHGAQEVRLGCDASSFDISVANDTAGTGPYGSNAANADPITFRVTLTPVSPGTAPWTGEARARIDHTERPNGPECVPTCYGRSGTLTLKR